MFKGNYLVVHPRNAKWLSSPKLKVKSKISRISLVVTGVTTHPLTGINHQVNRGSWCFPSCRCCPAIFHWSISDSPAIFGSDPMPVRDPNGRFQWQHLNVWCQVPYVTTWYLQWMIQWAFQEPIDWRYLPYIRFIFQAYVRGYTPKIWPYMVQYLHFRILKFPLNDHYSAYLQIGFWVYFRHTCTFFFSRYNDVVIEFCLRQLFSVGCQKVIIIFDPHFGGHLR